MSDAKLAGLLSKSGTWKTYPQRMLQMRARSWCLRDQFADLLCGLGVYEEQQDVPAPESTMVSGSIVDGTELDTLADALGDTVEVAEETTGPPSTEELVAAGELVEDPGVGALFDKTDNDGVGE